MAFLLRVELPDVPGSLGALATALGSAKADIEAIEIVEHRHDGTAVDDVLLEMAPGMMPDSVVSACSMLDGVHVLWVSRYAAGGNLFLDLEAVEAMTQDPAKAIATDFPDHLFTRGLIVLAVCVVILGFAQWAFSKLERKFAERL